MSKFKIGDSVVCVDETFIYALQSLQVGKTYRVSHVNGNTVGLENNPYTWWASRFILAGEPNGVDRSGNPVHFALRDFKDWMRVKLKNGIAGIIRTNNDAHGTCIIYNDGGFDSIDSTYFLKIDEIYSFGGSCGSINDRGHHSYYCVWKRQKIKSPQELAVEELEASIKASQDKLMQLKATL